MKKECRVTGSEAVLLCPTMSDENADESKENGNERNMGVQPMDGLMTQHEMNNHELLAGSPDPMTHKAVQRARKGRRLTRHMLRRMVEAIDRGATIEASGEHASLTYGAAGSYVARLVREDGVWKVERMD